MNSTYCNQSNNINGCYNISYNYNINVNNCKPTPEEPIIPPDMYIRIITYNGLVLIDDNGIIIQVENPSVPNIDIWNMITISGVDTIQNLATKRYITLQDSSGNPGTPIISMPEPMDMSSGWMVCTHTLVPTIPPRPDYSLIRTAMSMLPIVVPNNSDVSGISLEIGEPRLSRDRLFIIENNVKGI